MLFGDDPPSQKDNIGLVAWRGTKYVLPKFVTGAWEEDAGDTKPIEHIYNMIFVRLPTVVVGAIYIKNLVEGHPLVINFGHNVSGDLEVPSLIVFGIIYIILR